MTEVTPAELQHAVESQHECKATMANTVAVNLKHEGQDVWTGIVHVFALHGHRTADKAYAWSSPIEGSTKRRFFTVLHAAPIQSASDAVRAAIVAEHRSK
jgi:hypothetical protein